MKKNKVSKTKISTIIALVSVAGLVSLSPASAAQYQVTDIGSTETGFFSKAYEINNASRVVGREMDVNGNSNAFFWDPTAGISRLSPVAGPTRAMGINNQNQICGVSNSHAAYWESPISQPIELGTFGGPTSFGYKMGPNGQMVGWADFPDYSGMTIYHGFLYKDGVMTDLGTLANLGYYYNGYSLAYDVNSSGKVVGIAHDNYWYLHAFVWDSVNGMTDLGTNPNFPDHEGYAAVINESGSIIAGNSIDLSYNSYPMIWRNGATVAELVPTHSIYPYAEFYDINSSDTMVGIMWNSDQAEHAFIYTEETGIQDLNEMIPQNSGWELVFAKGINDSGQIVGHGRLNGEDHAYMLTPMEDDTTPPSNPTGLIVR